VNRFADAPAPRNGASPTLRVVAVLGGCVLAAVAATGKLTPIVFHQPSFTKYIVLVGGPTLVALLATARMPMRALVGAAILVAPLNFVMTFHGQKISPFMVVLFAATLVAAATVRTEPAGWLGKASMASGLLLVPAIASSSSTTSYLLWLVETLLIGWLVYVVAREPGGVKFVLVMIVASVAIQGALAFYEYRSGHQLNLYNSSGATTFSSNYFFSYGSAKRYTGTMPDPIALGNVLALGLPLMICLAVLTRRLWLRLLIAGVSIVSTLGLVLSLSRMSWIGGAVGVVVCLVLLPPRRRMWTTLAAAAAVALVIAAGLSLGGPELRRRFTSTLNPTSVQSSYSTTAQGDQLRVRLWSAAIKTAEAEPVTGTGFGNLVPALNEHGVSVPPAAHAQSWYLQLLGEAGILGAAALLCLLVAAIRDLWTGFGRYRVLAAGMAGAFVATLITWTTDIEPRYIQVGAVIAALFALIAAVGARRAPSGSDLA
jgi:O-antigen ligase